MRFFAIAIRSVTVLGMFTALSACSSVDDGYPKISDIKTPQPNFISPRQQQARKNQMERAKYDHVYRKRSQIRERSRWLKPKEPEEKQ